MRITNNIILHNTTSNINGNKVNVNNLNNQMTSQKKIQRPSENPVIAVRSLRLRTTLSEIDQYYENNIPDAESWMKVTETGACQYEDDSDGHPYTVYLRSVRSDYRRRPQDDLDPVREAAGSGLRGGKCRLCGTYRLYRLPHESEADLYDRRRYDILQYHTGTFL